MAYTCTQSRWLCTLARFRTVAILAQAIVCSSHFCSLRSYIILIGDALGAGPAPAASFCSSTPRPCLQPRGLDHFSQTRRAMLNARVCHATSSTRHTLPPKKVINWTMACSHWRRCGGTFSHVIILKPMLNLNVALTLKRSTFVLVTAAGGFMAQCTTGRDQGAAACSPSPSLSVRIDMWNSRRLRLA